MKAVIFDCFGVFYVDSVRMLTDSAPPALWPALHALVRDYDLGAIAANDLVAGFAKILNAPCDQIDKAIFGTRMARNQRLLDFAQSLRAKYKVGLLSNLAPRRMDYYFSPAEQQQYFDDVVVSGDVGLIKPDPRIFLLACQRLGVAPSEAMFIDDVAANCQAAAGLGMQAIVYEDNAQVEQRVKVLLEG